MQHSNSDRLSQRCDWCSHRAHYTRYFRSYLNIRIDRSSIDIVTLHCDRNSFELCNTMPHLVKQLNTNSIGKFTSNHSASEFFKYIVPSSNNNNKSIVVIACVSPQMSMFLCCLSIWMCCGYIVWIVSILFGSTGSIRKKNHSLRLWMYEQCTANWLVFCPCTV